MIYKQNLFQMAAPVKVLIWLKVGCLVFEIYQDSQED